MRKMKSILVDWFYTTILPSLAWILMNAVSVTVRMHSIGKEQVDALRKNGKRLVYIFWHGRHFLLVRYMADKNISILASTSRDGLLLTKVLQKSRYGIIPGSSDRSPAKALVGSIRRMKDGQDIAFAADGPKGPLHKIKPGSVYLAKKMNAYMVPASLSSHPALTLKSWDRYQIPRPFARAVIIFGRPILLSPEIDEKTILEECLRLENQLDRLTKQADNWVRPSK